MLLPSNYLQLNLSDISILNAKPIYFNYKLIQIYLVGCGGTGSFLAPLLCRLANFLSFAQKRVDLIFVDFDRVEEKNLWRQNFCWGELNYNKAQALAMRYKTAFPKLNIRAVQSNMNRVTLNESIPTLIIGCVDNPHARREIEQLAIEHLSNIAFGQTNIPCWWLDCGNGYTYGQVAIGNWYSLELEDYQLEIATCTKLPLPSIQYPQLLLPSIGDTDISCPEQIVLNGQSLNINSQMAVIAAEMTHQLLNSQLKRFQVELDLFRGSMQSVFITQKNIERAIERAKII